MCPAIAPCFFSTRLLYCRMPKTFNTCAARLRLCGGCFGWLNPPCALTAALLLSSLATVFFIPRVLIPFVIAHSLRAHAPVTLARAGWPETRRSGWGTNLPLHSHDQRGEF